MTNDELEGLAAAGSTQELVVALDNLSERPRDFVVATPEHVFVGGEAVAVIGGTAMHHTGDGTFTRHDLAPVEPAAPPMPAAPPVPVAPATVDDTPMPAPASDLTPAPPSDLTPAPASDLTPAPPPPPGSDVPQPPDRVASLGSSAVVADPSVASPEAAESSNDVLVRGINCQRDHHVHPDARMCPLCGDNMQNRSIVVNSDGSVGEFGPRPPLGVIILPDGRSYQLERNTVIGRAPEVHSDVVAGTADHIRVDDDELSRSHLRFVLDGWNVLVEDLGSTNGSRLGAGSESLQLETGAPIRLVRSAEIHVGTTILSYQPTSAAQT